MSRDKNRARAITQAQKRRQEEKAEALLPSRPVRLERKVTVRLDADRYDELEEFARKEGFTVSVIVRHLLCRFLEDQRRASGGRAL